MLPPNYFSELLFLLEQEDQMKTKADIAIDTLERFEINGTTQWVLIRGRRPGAPVLLLIQQGPGFAMIHEAPILERQLGLEAQFRVVYWDQRGTGKSFVRGAGHDTTVDDLAADVRAMVRELCTRCGVSHVHVVGFSLGGTIGLLAAATEPTAIASLVCVGPDINFLDSERSAYEFALAEAERRGNRRALRVLHAIGEPPHDNAKRFMTRVKWVSNFGGVHTGKTYNAFLVGAVAALWASPHYSVREMIRTLRAMSVTQAQMLPKLVGFDLLARRVRVDVPLVIFQGQLDVVSPPHLAARLAEHLGAGLVEFENSAHMPYAEEPVRFRAELLRFIDTVGNRPVSTTHPAPRRDVDVR
jgi:pimeloyl-ACP methyl ester carboxylesterase